MADEQGHSTSPAGRGSPGAWFPGERGPDDREVELHELALHFQPQFTLGGGELHGYEALLRWHDDTGEVVRPATFLHRIADQGMLSGVTRWVLDSVADQVDAWVDRLPPGARVALNVPAAALRDREVLEALRDLARERPATAERLALEVSEGEDPEQLLAACQRFVDRVGRDAFRLTLDDCGTGSDTARVLQEAPVHSIKLDNTVVAGMRSDRERLAVMHSMLQVARSRGLTVIAEGVEDAEQDRRLREAGCDVGQGHFYAHPDTAERAADWMPAPGASAGPA